MAASLARFVECGKIELEPCDVEIGELVLEAVNLVLPLCVLRKQLLVTDIASEGLVVNADARLLTQALERLLTNVAKLSARGATIAVTTRTHAARVVVTVTSATLPHESANPAQPERRNEDVIDALGLSYVAQLCELRGGALVATPGQLRVMLPRVE